MSIDKAIQELTFKVNLLPGDNAGEASVAAMQAMFGMWATQNSQSHTSTTLANMAVDMEDMLNNLSKLQQLVQTRLESANAAYLKAAKTGSATDLEDAKTAGADLATLGDAAIDYVLTRTDGDYAAARKVLEHRYGSLNLPTFDGMSALGHTIEECVSQVKNMASTVIAVEKGIELPDLFTF